METHGHSASMYGGLKSMYIAMLQLIQVSIDGGREFQLDLWDFYYAEDH